MTNWRYIAQRALTGEFLEWDLPVHRDELRWDLSGSGALRGTVSPDVGQLRDRDGSLLLDEWGTFLYAEADGQIRWGGILISSGFDGPSWSLEAAGFTAYPHGLPYLHDWRRVNVDPMDAVREIWRHMQENTGGNLGMVVDQTTTPRRLGTDDEPYELVWWESPDCGSELDSLAKETPFDYYEEHYWAGEAEIAHRLRLAYPRTGRRRHDLAFVQGDNVTDPIVPAIDGDVYANEVVGIGKGEGRSSLITKLPERDGRLRRPVVYTDKGVGTKGRLQALIRDELNRRRPVLEISEISVIDHPHAGIGSWQLGDDILVQASIPWVGDVEIWSRIVSWSLESETRARLRLARSDRFRYGSVPSV